MARCGCAPRNVATSNWEFKETESGGLEIVNKNTGKRIVLVEDDTNDEVSQAEL